MVTCIYKMRGTGFFGFLVLVIFEIGFLALVSTVVFGFYLFDARFSVACLVPTCRTHGFGSLFSGFFQF